MTRHDPFPLAERIAMDPESAERGLASLVLTVVELLRQLVERQAIRRVDGGDLTAAEIERIGSTLMRLEQGMRELCEHFDLTLDDLNLDLGPLGTLLPNDRG
ncbi:Gas vesicle protein K [Actinokineospora alba]|uniref:Gas vesicle protein K n=1 Tax=Actinokineospora alba TaxID=504798 RepID=A0A1H0LWR8_9PSEU|nr:gas vesicle protein K [Actinokineospora alba]TDP67486.1 gas vesicle protein GvpK [Actinokineospora alba]SDI47159.1 Gas vesicle protein K [Actinokineospora alba]SDO72544.1 Gas vesicle protein K [Actinokineospora alba]